MQDLIFEPILWAAIIGIALMAGVYFTFSVFIMKSLEALPHEVAIASMNSINKVILKSGFMPLFFGSSFLSAILIFLVDAGPSGYWVITGSAVYLLGMLVCTITFNVPLNNQLRDAPSNQQLKMWQHYLIHWTRWNHLRAISSLLAFVFYVIALK
jgi:uncharacterized membrane protein